MPAGPAIKQAQKQGFLGRLKRDKKPGLRLNNSSETPGGGSGGNQTEIVEDAPPAKQSPLASFASQDANSQRDQIPQVPSRSLLPGLPSMTYKPAPRSQANKRPQSAKSIGGASSLTQQASRKSSTGAGARTPANSRPSTAQSQSPALNAVHEQSVALVDGLWGQGSAAGQFGIHPIQMQKG